MNMITQKCRNGRKSDFMKSEFPIIKAGHIFNDFSGDIDNKNYNLKLKEVDIDYPCRLDAMAINPAAVCYNSDMIFTPGEVVISIKKFINIKIKVLNEDGGQLSISSNTKRKVLVKHAYLLMCKALNISPSLEIDVDDKNILKHCGFGSSSSTIAAVSAAINELYGCPIKNEDLIKYLASNHGEEVSDADEENLKVVQCIGGGATNGLTEDGVIIIAGKSTSIAQMKYDGEVLICIPTDFEQKDAKLLMELEEKNLWKFKKTGDEFSERIAYDLLHKALPDMRNGRIDELAKIVFDYRFNMGSIENCSFVYDKLPELANSLRVLYERKICEFLALSSVGPAFFVIGNSNEQKKECIKKMEELDMIVYETSICNSKYLVNSLENKKNFWQQNDTGEQFRNRAPSKYITDEIDRLDISKKKCIDIGCGGGRYSNYLNKKAGIVLAVDKYPEMFGNENNKKINFIETSMDKIPVKDESYYLVLSIGVIHNAITFDEYLNSLKEIFRITQKNGYIIISIFTNDIITSDLKCIGENIYNIDNRPPMVLMSKKQIENLINDIGFKIIKVVDEHITDVGIGKRNVYTLLLQK